MKTVLNFLDALVLVAILVCIIGFCWAMWDAYQLQTTYVETWHGYSPCLNKDAG